MHVFHASTKNDQTLARAVWPALAEMANEAIGGADFSAVPTDANTRQFPSGQARISTHLHRGADLPGHKLIVAVAQRFRLRWRARRHLQDRFKNFASLVGN